MFGTFSPRRALFGLLTLATFLVTNHATTAAERPNVVMVLADDLGYADLGCMGGDLRTPHLDRLAREGVRFTDFYSNAPVCTPTRCALMTGRYQQRVGLEWAMGFTAEQFRREGETWVPEPDKLGLGLPTAETSLARMLKSAGYGTGAFGKWHLGFKPEYSPNRHGFDEYFGTLLGHTDYYRYVYFDGTKELFENEKPVEGHGYHTDLIGQRAVDYIHKQGKNPFFMYVPFQAVHWPFQPPDRPEPALTKDNKYDGTRQDYAAMVERMDHWVGQMLAALEKQGVANNTLFVFSSDNGGERLSNNLPLFNHKTTLWEGGIRVPCLMRWPARLPAGLVTKQPAITMDLTATILAATGATAPAGRALDGINLLPLLTSTNAAQAQQERTFCWRVARTGRHMKAIRQGKWKYVEDDMVEMLYDLEADISERRDLAYHHPDVVRRLKQALAEWEAEFEKNPPAFVVR